MKLLHIKIFILAIAWLSCVNAWHLDNSCERLGYRDIVRDGMISAIDLAQAAADPMQALKDQTHSEAQMDLFEYMFSFAVKTVLNFKHSTDQKVAEDVVIYCDYSRYIEGTQCNGDKKKNMACDKDTSEDVKINSVFNWCKSKTGYFPIMGLTSSNGVSNFAQMDLCAWYLKFLSTSKKQYWTELASKSLLAWPIHKIYNVTLLRTQMDAAALLDHTILHELTHAIPLRATTDTSKFFSYGWKRCVSLGKSRDSGINNADNYAYFALGARMISPRDGKAPMRPMKDGSINPKKRQNQRRSVSAPVEYDDEPTPGNVASSDTHARQSLHPINNQTTTTDHATSSQPAHHIAMNTIHDPLGPSHMSQSNSLSAALLPPEARTRDPDHNTFTGTPVGLPLTSSTHSTEPTSRMPMASGDPSKETSSSSTQPSTQGFNSKSLNPSSPRPSMTQAPSPGGVQPTSISINLTRSTSASSSNPTDFGIQTNPSPTPPNISPIQASTDKSPSQITTSSSNHTTAASTPITVFAISNADISTSITYIATNTVDSNNQPTDVWKCTGDLCDTSSSRSCIIPAFCADEQDLGPSWGLCCGFLPIPVPGGGSLLPGGPPSPPIIGPPAPPGPLGPPAGGGGGGGGGSSSNNSHDKGGKNDDDDDKVSEGEKNTHTSASTTGRSTSPSTSKSDTVTSTSPELASTSATPTSTEEQTCTQTATASTCTMTISVSTPLPTGTHTPTPETKTIKACQTVLPNACPLTVSTTITTLTPSADATASPIEHYWDWDGQHNWLEVQQSILEELETASPLLSSPSITTTETSSKPTLSAPAWITAAPATITAPPPKIFTVTREQPPTTTAPTVTTTDPAPIIGVITLPTTLITLRKFLCTPSFNIWRDPQWLCYCPRTTSSSSTTLFVPPITNNLCRYTSIPDPLPSMSISWKPKVFNTDSG